MNDTTAAAQTRAQGTQKTGAFARQVLDLFAERLRDHAAQGDGRLNARDIQLVLDGFDPARDAAVQAVCDAAWMKFQRDFEEDFFSQMRKHPLERLIVGKFEHLLPPRGADPVPDRTLSRRVIPAFVQALHQMVGPELFDEYENRARGLIDTIRAHTGGVDWERLPEHPTAKVLVNDILIYIARYFTDVPKRRAWMVGFFDRSMATAQTPGEKAWIFDDMAFHKLMSSLYKELADALFDPVARQGLEARYDPASLSLLEQILAGLAQDQRRLMKL